MNWLKITLSAAAFSLLSPLAALAAEDEFCSATGLEQLQAIEGNWTFKQEAGYGIGGKVLPFPLPPHAPQSVRIELNPEEGVAYLKHAGQRMAMIPVDTGFARELRFYLSDEEEAKILAPGSGCDWAVIPLVVGANTYSLAEPQGTDRANQIITLSIGDDTLFRCSNGAFGRDEGNETFAEGTIISNDADGNIVIYDPKTGETTDLMEEATAEDKKGWGELNQDYIDRTCGRPVDLPAAKLGQMVMSLIVKFDSPNSGAGVLQFNGQQGPVTFAARAPVRLSR